MRRLLPFAVLAAACLLVAAAGGDGLSRLAYARWAIRDGEVWRLLTTHLVHAGGAHLAWNLAGLALVAFLAARELGPGRWAAVMLISGLGGSLGVLLLSPRTAAMAGLSGLLHGLLAACGAAALRVGEPGSPRRSAGDRLVGAAILAALAAKLAAERWDLWPAAAQLGRETALDAHIYGALAGGVAGLLLAPAARRRDQAERGEEQHAREVPAREQREEPGP